VARKLRHDRDRKGGFRRPGLAFLFLVLALHVLASTPIAQAHRRHAGAPLKADGIPIPSLSHGQMAVLSRYRVEILDLAARQARADPVFRRLLRFGNTQYAYCLWGLVPGSIADEESPFNECSHAYLAATRALLLHMAAAPDGEPASALVQRIELDMLINRTSLVLCRYSEEPFNTAEIVQPRWREVPSHPASLLAFLGLMGAPGLLYPMLRWLPRANRARAALRMLRSEARRAMLR